MAHSMAAATGTVTTATSGVSHGVRRAHRDGGSARHQPSVIRRGASGVGTVEGSRPPFRSLRFAATDGHPRSPQARARHSPRRHLELPTHHPHQREPPQRRPLNPRRDRSNDAIPTKGRRRSGDRSNATIPTRGSARRRDRSNDVIPTNGRRRRGDRSTHAATAHARASCRNCPHAAAMSRPRLARIWLFTCLVRRISWNRRTSSVPGRTKGTPSTSL